VVLNLLPHPRRVELQSGIFTLPDKAALELDDSLPRSAAASIARRLNFVITRKRRTVSVRAIRSEKAPAHIEGYLLTVSRSGVRIVYREVGGLHAAVATLRQLMREHGRQLPFLRISDYPDFSRRGVMLDISRGRVPKLETLLELVEQLADFKINEFQLYIEHTFAYRKYGPVWRDWGAIKGAELRQLDARCRELGIELVPNQNSFGHLREWLAYPPLRKLAEVSRPWADEGGAFLRRPSTLAPNHPGTLPFLRGLYNELLPNFTSGRFNVGCDETWDLGRGQSWQRCEQLGKGRVYLDFLHQVHREVSARGKRMMFWGDIVLHYPELAKELPRDVIALNWGYEAKHPFARETAVFAKAGVPFYVCPGTSTWMSLIGKHDNAFANMQNAARAGRKHGAEGFLICDWGDGGHPQPLAISYIPYLYGASVSWCADSFEEKLLLHVTNRDIFHDATGRTGEVALGLGLAHRKFRYVVPNLTPFGAVLAAPPPKQRELYCRDGLKYYARISEQNIRAALEEVEAQRSVLFGAQPATRAAEIAAAELDLAARMAAQSCHYMLWQQALVAWRKSDAALMAKRSVLELRRLEEELDGYWPARNKGTTKKCSPFLGWRIEDYRRGVPHFPPAQAA
jgi:hypothetical protein